MKKLIQLLMVFVSSVFLSGCATQAMKGTPFYSGEYSVRQGPVEDRVNIWPLFYYRDPAMSALWPLIEKTEDHFALRPVYSLYGLDTDEPVHNILWPIAQFNSETKSNRIFPVFWSSKRDYVYIFPLYWHSKDPYGPKGGVDTLFPLWIIDQDENGYDNSFLWPFSNFSKRKSPYCNDWYIWPLAGHKENQYKTESYYLWPLIWDWSQIKNNDKGSAVLPLYYYESDDKGSKLFTIPYSCGSSTDGDTSWQFTFPLFYHKKDSDGSILVSLPYWSGNSIEKNIDWSMLAPFYYTKRKADDRLVVTLLGGYSREGEDTSWLALPLLSGGRKGPDSSDTWIAGPLAHAGRSGDASSSHLFPLYYSSESKNSSTFVSLPWSSGREGNDSWQLVPLLYFGMQSEISSKMITPLYAAGIDKDADRWHAIVPLYYRSKKSGTFVSSLFVRFKNDSSDRITTILPPLLSWYSGDDKDSDLWIGGPLAHWSWGEEADARHILPLFYSNSKKDNFVSLPYSKWKSGEKTTRAIPPLLSWISSEDDTSDLWLLGPLAHWSWGENADTKHIFPLFYSDREKDRFISPLLVSWKDEDWENWCCPPLLSWYSSDSKSKSLNILLGIFNQTWGQEGVSGQLLPAYMYRGKQEVYTPLFGWNTSEDTKYTYPLTPLVGFWYGDDKGWWLQPLGSYKLSGATGRIKGNFLWGSYWKDKDSGGSGIFPIYHYKNYGSLDSVPETIAAQHVHKRYGKDFFCLPIIWYKNQIVIRPDYGMSEDGKKKEVKRYVQRHERSKGIFPIWNSSSLNVPEDKMLDADYSLLWLLYDYKHEVRQLKDNPASTSDYTRRRILWRLWHYERFDGEVSVDMFPAITYDRKEDGFKRVSFLWRFFRYEREPDGNRKLDLLFLPIMR